MENEIKDFWNAHPCGAQLVGDLSEESRAEYEEFFRRYDKFRYAKEAHILKNLDTIDFADKRVLEIGLGQGADGEQIAGRGAIYNGVDLTGEAVRRTSMRFKLRDLSFERIEQASALELPFEDNSFDVVFSHGVLHHIPEIGGAQKEISRVLKPDGKLIAMVYAKWSINYLLSISVARRLGLIAMYALNFKPEGIYGNHIANARKTGLFAYLKMSNFIHVSTDGPFNPYSKVYDRREIERDFTNFTIVETHKEFMHAPPLPVSWLPLSNFLGWHLWATLKPRK